MLTWLESTWLLAGSAPYRAWLCSDQERNLFLRVFLEWNTLMLGIYCPSASGLGKGCSLGPKVRGKQYSLHSSAWASFVCLLQLCNACIAWLTNSLAFWIWKMGGEYLQNSFMWQCKIGLLDYKYLQWAWVWCFFNLFIFQFSVYSSKINLCESFYLKFLCI